MTIIYDNEIFLPNQGLQKDWGFSCLVQTDTHTLLFDTGADAQILLSNMKHLDIDPDDIDTIVISHEHWDHNGGLKGLLPFVSGKTLYRFDLDQCFDTMKCVPCEHPCTITDDIQTTGRLKGFPVDEQSLLLNGEEGLTILVGCSHPGVDAIVSVAKKHGKIDGIIGGFHGFKTYDVLNGLNLICPCHCTQHISEIRQHYPHTTVSGGVGKQIEL